MTIRTVSSEKRDFETRYQQLKIQLDKIPDQGIPLSKLSLPNIFILDSNRFADLLRRNERIKSPAIFQDTPLILTNQSDSSLNIFRSDDGLTWLGLTTAAILLGSVIKGGEKISLTSMVHFASLENHLLAPMAYGFGPEFSRVIAEAILSENKVEMYRGFAVLNHLFTLLHQDRFDYRSVILLDEIGTSLKMQNQPLSDTARQALSEIQNSLKNVEIPSDLILKAGLSIDQIAAEKATYLPEVEASMKEAREILSVYILLAEYENKCAERILTSSFFTLLRRFDRKGPFPIGARETLNTYFLIDYLAVRFGDERSRDFLKGRIYDTALLTDFSFPEWGLVELMRDKVARSIPLSSLEILTLSRLSQGDPEIREFLADLSIRAIDSSKNYPLYLRVLKELANRGNLNAMAELFKMAEAKNSDAILLLRFDMGIPPQLSQERIDLINVVHYFRPFLDSHTFSVDIKSLFGPERRFFATVVREAAEGFLSRSKSETSDDHHATYVLADQLFGRRDLFQKEGFSREFLEEMRQELEFAHKIASDWKRNGAAGELVSIQDFTLAALGKGERRWLGDTGKWLREEWERGGLPRSIRAIAEQRGTVRYNDKASRFEVSYNYRNSPSSAEWMTFAEAGKRPIHPPVLEMAREETEEDRGGEGRSSANRSGDRSSNRGVEARGGRGVSPKSPSSREEGREGSDSKRGERDHGLDPIDPFNLGRRGPIK